MPKTQSFDHYEVLTREDGSPFELGRGAMGITYKAFDTSLRINVALKVINAAYLQSEIARQRFVREARAAAQLRHPNVASVFHLGMSGDAYFYAMEFVDGETVESLIKRGGPVDPALALRITLQVTRALGAAAKHHLVQRDIKPANLMLVKEDDDYVVKVIDFGLAKSNKREAGEDLATLSMGGFVGTAHFASPEQLEEKEIDVRSDIYSLGVTLWYMLAGRAPFGGSIAQVMSQHLHKPPPLDQLEKLPATLRTLVGHMIEKDPAKRPQTPAELRSELEKCLASLQLGGNATAQDFPTVTEETRPTAAENKPVAIASPPPAKYLRIAGWSGAVLLLIAIALFAFYKLRSVEKVPPQLGLLLFPANSRSREVPLPSLKQWQAPHQRRRRPLT
jgi:serine/threonine protein kinase